MTIIQQSLSVNTSPRKTHDITRDVQALVMKAGVETGLCHLFIKHTSASLILCENADPTVKADLERFMQSIVPDGDPMFAHDVEGPDDMPAHIRTIFTNVSLTIPITNGRCNLGTWQGIYLWEHRTSEHHRKVIVTINGE